MDRKGILGIVLAVIGFVSWQIYYNRATHLAQQAQQEAAALAPAAPAAATPSASPAPNVPPSATPASPLAPAPTAEAAAAPEIVKLATSAVEYTFTNLGGGIASARLLNHNAEQGSVVLNEFGSLPIGAMSEVPGEGAQVPYRLESNPAAGEIRFERTDSRQLQVTKRFVLPKLEGADKDTLLRQEYSTRLELTLTNRSAQPLQVPAYFLNTGAAAPNHQRDLPTYTGFNYLRDATSKFIDVNWFSGGGFFPRRAPTSVYTDSADKIRWAGVTNQYFTTLLSPALDENATSDMQAKLLGNQVWARRFVIADAAWQASGHSIEGKGSAERFGVDGALGMPALTLKPGESFLQTFELYTGPREYRRLKALGHGEAEIMNFGMFGIVSKTLLNTMNTLRAWFGNYAWAIIVLTLLIKTLLWPLQNKATRSMKKMQALQPKMTELKEKYKDDPTRMNTELMRLYKDYDINPLSGCLPMVIQIPIFFGFYSMLGKAVELRNSKFLWVDDLSQPDTVAHLFGYPVNVLPLCMAATMLVQMAIQPKSGDPAQQRIMMFMPLIFVFFCYNFASALALYWTVQNVFSIVQLLATRNQAAPTLVKAPTTKKKSRV